MKRCSFDTYAVLVTLLFVAGVFSYRGATDCLTCDELLFVRAVGLGPLDGLMQAGSSHPPLLRWVMTPLVAANGSDLVLRVPSILASLVGLFLTWRILRRLFDDPVTIGLLVPVIGLGELFLVQGYQCTPYALLMCLTVGHFLSWFRLLEQDRPFARIVFVLTAAAAGWTHFYGFNLLVADQIMWLLIAVQAYRCPTQGPAVRTRTWLFTSLAAWLLVAPVVPLARFYMNVEQPFAILQIDNYVSYFFTASADLFFRVTFFGRTSVLPMYVLWYGAAMAVLWFALKSRDRDRRWRCAIVLCGAFLVGFPAMQAHALLSGKAMWQRYAIAGAWVHIPLLTLLVGWLTHVRITRSCAACWLALGMSAFAVGTNWMTWRYQDAAEFIRAQHRAGDAFLAQDMDMWVGEANMDRLWFERYVHVDIPIVSGLPARRHQLRQCGLPLDEVARTVRRLWVCSPLYSDRYLRTLATREWQLVELRTFARHYPVALFERRAAKSAGNVGD